MTKTEIQLSLNERYSSFITYLEGLDDNEFEYVAHGKWTAGQQVDHLVKAVDPIAKGLILPLFALKWIFGTSNRPSKSYEALVEKYKLKLADGGKASGRFIPKKVHLNQRKKVCHKLSKAIATLVRRLDNLSEDALDILILPHPLLGKLTLREMMYFTIYHAEHHHNLTKNNLIQIRD